MSNQRRPCLKRSRQRPTMLRERWRKSNIRPKRRLWRIANCQAKLHLCVLIQLWLKYDTYVFPNNVTQQMKHRKLLREVASRCSVSVTMKYDTSVCAYECKTLPWQLERCTKHQSWPQDLSIVNGCEKLTRDVLFQLRLNTILLSACVIVRHCHDSLNAVQNISLGHNTPALEIAARS